jgi:cobalt-zinc-cadmium efflux system membrane fusion protein
MIRPFLVLVWPLAIACAAGCSSRTGAASAADTATPATASPGRITLDATMRSSVTVQRVEERSVADQLAIGAKVQFDEDRLARILVPVAGQIADLRVKVGDVVRKGQLLCAINSRDAAAAVAEHLESHNDLALAEKTAAMTQDLFDHDAASRIALHQAQSDLEKARSRVARTDETMRVLGLAEQPDLAHFNGRVPIAATIGGSLIDRKIIDGQFVPADSAPIMTIADPSTVWVVGDLFERDLSRASVGQAATITTAAYPDEQFHGRVTYISEAIDPQTRTAKVRVSVANPGGRLKPEMFATINLESPGAARRLMVPARALFTEEGKSYVFAEVADGVFEKRAVDVEPGEGAERGIRGGLRGGDRVVVDGALLVRQEQQQRAS